MSWIKQLAQKYAPMLDAEDRRRGAAGLLPLAWMPEGNYGKAIPGEVIEALQAAGMSHPIMKGGKITRSWTVPGTDAATHYAQKDLRERQRQKYGSWYAPRGTGREFLS
jgi:hypothetical protein